MIKIGYLGPKGTFSHEALKKYMTDRPCEECGYASIPEIMSAVGSGELDEGLVPIENSIEGAVNATLDMLVFEVDLLIKSEFVMHINENLLVKKGTKMEDIKYVLSHPQPLGQCRRYLAERLPSAEVLTSYSTSVAAEEAAKGKGDCAAIGSAAAANVYGLEILETDIHDCDNNHTRFVAIARRDSGRTGRDKTSIVFSTEDRPGSLYRILDIFNLWDVNMSRIESRPAKDRLGRYVFFVDLEGHSEDENIRDALTMVKRKTSFYKFLGSYPVFEE